MSDRPNRRGSRSGGPTRTQSDLADVVELLLDKGIVINADIAVSIGDAELLGIQLRAAIASFETAAKYGLEFPTGTDTDRIEEIAEATSIDRDDDGEDREIDRSEVGPRVMGLHEPPISDSSPSMSGAPISEPDDGDENTGEETKNGDETDDIVSGNDTYDSGSEPGVRQRPTAPDAAGDEENSTEDGSTDNGDSNADAETGDDGANDDRADAGSEDSTDGAASDDGDDDEGEEDREE